MKLKAIIFDKDGTLLDFDLFWGPVSVSAMKVFLQKLNIYDVPVNVILEAIGIIDGLTDIKGVFANDPYPVISKVLQEKLEEYGYAFDFEYINSVLVECYHDNLDKGKIIPLCNNIREVLVKLKNNGIMLFVATSDDLKTTLSCLKSLNIQDVFDKIYTLDDGFPTKPMPDIIEDISKKYKLKKNEMMMVGDTLTDIRFARNGQIKSVGVAKSLRNKAILKLESDYVIDDLSHLFEIVCL